MLDLYSTDLWWLVYAVLIWTLPWEAYALWTSARKKHKYWFLFLFLINALAIPEIIYIFIFSKEKYRKRFYALVNRNKK